MSSRRVGDRLTLSDVTVEVTEISGGFTQVSIPGVGRAILDFHPDWAIEEVKPAEPEYIPGQWYEDAKGATYFRRTVEDGWVRALTGARVSHDYPARPLRRLVPEGE